MSCGGAPSAELPQQPLGVTTVSRVIQNSLAKPLRTSMDCNGSVWPETASEATGSQSKPWHPRTAVGSGKQVGSAYGSEGWEFESLRARSQAQEKLALGVDYADSGYVAQ
jgi:hypothetical protein